MIRQVDNLEFQIQEALKRIGKGRMRKMRCRHISGGIRYYLIEGGRERCIGDEDSNEVKKIKDERFAKVMLVILAKNIKSLKRCIHHYTDIDTDSVNDLLPKTYRIFCSTESTPLKKKSKIQRVSRSVSACITVDGRRVRSKCETIIYNLLAYSGLDFDYEKMLSLKDNEGNRKVIIPDFTIFLDDGRKIFREHMGMLNDEDYSSRQWEKIKLYHDNGITIGDNLILTADKNDGTVNSEIFGEIIHVLKRMDSGKT